jgi:three-Cys-motif partner protein
MALGPEHYAGREQAYVKHFLLGHYFSDLVHKVAGRFDEIVYVDGFSGPWQSEKDDLGDTSFGIALAAMRSAKVAWSKLGRNVQMHALLVERNKKAFGELEKVPAKYPDISVRPYHGEFVPLVSRLSSDMPKNAFAFIFIDPKGWRIDIDSVAPLLQRPNTEVLFNFMFDFINRAASMNDPAIVEGLNALIKTDNWRQRLAQAQPEGAQKPADIRKAILVDAFSQTLAKLGGYSFVADTPIFKPLADRTLYSLIYATRKPSGIAVFRRAQLKALLKQEVVRANKRQEKKSGAQREAFLPSEMNASETESYLEFERISAERYFIELASDHTPAATYGELWPKVLAKHVITKKDLNSMAASLRADGRLSFPDWTPRKRIPEDGWRVFVPKQG